MPSPISTTSLTVLLHEAMATVPALTLAVADARVGQERVEILAYAKKLEDALQRVRLRAVMEPDESLELVEYGAKDENAIESINELNAKFATSLPVVVEGVISVDIARSEDDRAIARDLHSLNGQSIPIRWDNTTQRAYAELDGPVRLLLARIDPYGEDNALIRERFYDSDDIDATDDDN